MIQLRPHHAQTLNYWMQLQTAPIQRFPGSLDNQFKENGELLRRVLILLERNQDLPVEFSDKPDFICNLCPGYDTKLKRCGRFYDDDPIGFCSPEETRKATDRETRDLYHVEEAKTIGDVIQGLRRKK